MPRIFVTIILIVSTLALAVLYLGDEWEKFSTLRKEIDELGNISVELDELIADRDKLVEVINSLSQEDLSRISQAIPLGPKAADLMVLMENLTTSHSMVLNRIDLAGFTSTKTGEPEPGGAVVPPPRPGALPSLKPRSNVSIKDFPLTMNVNGTYETFKTFLRDLEHNLRIIDVEDLSFSAPGSATGNKTPTVDFLIKAKTYYQ